MMMEHHKPHTPRASSHCRLCSRGKELTPLLQHTTTTKLLPSECVIRTWDYVIKHLGEPIPSLLCLDFLADTNISFYPRSYLFIGENEKHCSSEVLIILNKYLDSASETQLSIKMSHDPKFDNIPIRKKRWSLSKFQLRHRAKTGFDITIYHAIVDFNGEKFHNGERLTANSSSAFILYNLKINLADTQNV